MKIRFLKFATMGDITQIFSRMKSQFYKCYFSGKCYYKNPKNQQFVKIDDFYVTQFIIKNETTEKKIRPNDVWAVIKYIASGNDTINPIFEKNLKLHSALKNIDVLASINKQVLSNADKTDVLDSLVMFFQSVQYFLENKECEFIFTTNSKEFADFVEDQMQMIGHISQYKVKNHDSKFYGNLITIADTLPKDVISKSKNLMLIKTNTTPEFYGNSRIIHIDILKILDIGMFGGVVKKILASYTQKNYLSNTKFFFEKKQKCETTDIKKFIAKQPQQQISARDVINGLSLDHNRALEMRIGKILVEMGYKKIRRIINDRRYRFYLKPMVSVN